MKQVLDPNKGGNQPPLETPEQKLQLTSDHTLWLLFIFLPILGPCLKLYFWLKHKFCSYFPAIF